MPTPSKVEGLPEPLKAWLESELERRKYTGYETLASDLNQKLAGLGAGHEMLSSESVRRFASRRRFALEMDAAVREEMQKLAAETGGIDAAAWDVFYVNRMRMLIARGILEAGQREQVNIRDLERLHRMAMQLEKRGSSPGRTPHPLAPSPGTGEGMASPPLSPSPGTGEGVVSGPLPAAAERGRPEGGGVVSSGEAARPAADTPPPRESPAVQRLRARMRQRGRR